jgi:hypothetical protein
LSLSDDGHDDGPVSHSRSIVRVGCKLAAFAASMNLLENAHTPCRQPQAANDDETPRNSAETVSNPFRRVLTDLRFVQCALQSIPAAADHKISIRGV